MNEEATQDIDQMLADAMAEHREGALTKAEWGYQGVLEIDPKNVDALHLLGVIAHQLGATDEAIEKLKEALAIRPDHPSALNNLGNMFAQSDRPQEAIEAYEKALSSSPDRIDTLHNLGNVLGDVERVDEAIASYRRVIDLDAENVESRLAVGALLEKTGELEEAACEYREALKRDPEAGVTYSRLGSVLRKQGRMSEAKTVYEDWSRLAPDNAVAAHFLTVCDPQQSPDRASPEYVKTTFDNFAEEFDECLAGLDYRVPELCGKLAESFLGQRDKESTSVADLGCGTGLCGPLLRPSAGQLVGVDLSTGMLEKARDRSVYDDLVESDLVDFLEERPDEFDLLVVADTLIYLGDLRQVFAASHQALRSEGAIVFSAEKDNATDQQEEGPGFRLDRSGRYQHCESRLREWLGEAGFEVREFAEETLRTEGDELVAGWMIVAVKR